MSSNVHSEIDRIEDATHRYPIHFGDAAFAKTKVFDLTETKVDAGCRRFGEYDILKILGRGGMGSVYLAEQRGLKRYVAFKMLPSQLSMERESLARFRLEAEMLARLQHPSIVQVFDSGLIEGTPFLAMEYVEGGSLAEKLKEGKCSAIESAALMLKMARGVGLAHQQEIIHRDLKPANILMTIEGLPKVADFGLARHADDAHLTQTGYLAGTPAYMSPEQLIASRALGPTSDVWSLGVILYEMLTGTTPFAGEDPTQILHHITKYEPVSPRVWLPTLSRDLETICLKCLQKEPDRRYANANDLADDLERFVEHRTIMARPVSKVEKGWRWCRRNPTIAILSAGIACTMIIATTVSTLFAEWAWEQREQAIQAAQKEVQLREAAIQAKEAQDLSLIAEKRSREESEAAKKQAESALKLEEATRAEYVSLADSLQSVLLKVKAGEESLNEIRIEMDRLAANIEVIHHNPSIQAKMYYMLSMARRNMADYNKSVELLERCYALRVEHLGKTAELTRETARELAYTYIHVDRGEESLKLYQPIVEARIAELPPDSREEIDLLSGLRLSASCAKESDLENRLSDRILTLCIKHHGPDHPVTEWHRINDRRFVSDDLDPKQVIPVLEKAFSCFRKHCNPQSTEILWTRGQLAHYYFKAMQYELALPLFKETYDRDLAYLGLGHHFSLQSAEQLAKTYEVTQRYTEAISLRKQLKEHYERVSNSELAAHHDRKLSENIVLLKMNPLIPSDK
jgi:eukaryotic-like serine/threonine-protein kinase